MFSPPYFIVVYALYIIGYTVQGTVTTSAQTLLTNDPKQRPIYGFFTGFFMLFLQTGITMLVSNYLVPKYGGMTLEFFSEIIVWVIAIAFVLMICSLIAIAPKDKPEYYNSMVKNKEEKVSFKTYWEVLKHNRALQMLVISESTDKLATSIAGNSIVGVMLYGIIIGDYAVMGRLSAITMIPNIILLVIGIMGARHSGQKKTYVATVYGCIAVQLAITLLLIFGDPTKIDLKSFGFMNIAFVVLIIALNGIRNIGSNMMIPMMADCTDYEVYRSGHYVPGLIATVYSFIDKLISSFATTVVGAFVAVIGYKNSVPQVGDASTPEILMITILLFCGMPILGWIASIIAMKFYPLTGEKSEMSDSEIEKWETKIKDSLLRRDSTLSTVMSAMTTAMSGGATVNGKTYFLSNFGISTLGYMNAAENEQNAYHIDGDEDDENTSGNTDKLMTALNSDPDTVMDFMKQMATNLYNAIDKQMTSTTLRSKYSIYNDKEMTTQYKNYTTTIKEWETKISNKEDYYYKKFSSMESALSKLNSQTSSLSGLIGSN